MELTGKSFSIEAVLGQYESANARDNSSITL